MVFYCVQPQFPYKTTCLPDVLESIIQEPSEMLYKLTKTCFLSFCVQISEEIQENEKWKVAYMIGAANEMYTAPLSSAFNGLSFVQAVE